MSPDKIFLAIFLASVLGFGGLGSLPVLRSQLSAHGITPDTLVLPALAVGNLSPGPNGLYLVAVGYLLHGIIGASLAVAAILLPPLLVLLLDRTRARLIHLRRFRSALASLSLAVVALLALSSTSLVQHAATNLTSIAFVVLGAALLLRRVPPLLIVIIAALTGLAL